MTLLILMFFCFGKSGLAQQLNTIVEEKSSPIAVSADAASRWKQGDYDVWHLSGNLRISQGRTTVTAPSAIIWSEKADPSRQIPAKLIVYAEGDSKNSESVIVKTLHGGTPHASTGDTADLVKSKDWLGRFYSDFGVQFNLPIVGDSPKNPPAIFQRALLKRKSEATGGATLVQFQQPVAPPANAPQVLIQPPLQNQLPSTKIEFTPRSKNPLNIRSFPSPGGGENILLYSGGVRVTIEGDRIQELQNSISSQPDRNDRITIEADTVVAWTNPIGQLIRNQVPTSSQRWEVYLEGNVVFSTNDRVVYANQMYYDVTNRRGTILQAEFYTPVDGYEGMLRLKADVLEQIDENNLRAYGSAVTSSRIGVPRYWLQSEVLHLNRQPTLDFNEFGQPRLDPATGQPESSWRYDGTSQNNFVYMMGLPVFYWPIMRGNSDQGSFYLSGLTVKNDSVYGFQTYSKFNAFQLFGIRRPHRNTDWDINLDFLSQRGFGFGTEGNYDSPDPYGFRELNKGRFEIWGLFENGLDNLGRDRRTLTPEKNFRGRGFWQHRNRFTNGFEFTAEVGVISDRNFLEQYREREWDENKDQITGFQLKRLLENHSFNLSAHVRTNDFFTQSNRLPAINYFLLGQPLLNDRLTWSSHSFAGYQDLEIADAPLDPVDAAKFDPLAWELAREGIVAGTRQEISMPLQTGLVRTTPYLLGGASYYGEDLTGVSVGRTFGQAGVRMSLPMVSVNPNYQNVLLNVNGVAHKVEWEADLSIAEASQDITRYPLYHELDDDAQEHFRRRLFFDSFGGAAGGNVAFQFDERNFAFRSGMQSRVTAASPEIVDDLMVARIGVNQRWQTKRGPAGNQHQVDWIVWDVHASLFPKENRDNFGEVLGVVDYDFRWHIGDRLTLLSDAYADFFSQGLKTISIGGQLSRPEIGNLYLGFRSIEGPISANVLNSRINHRLSEKWAVTLGTSVDFGKSGNLGQRFAISRIGESAILRAGVNVDVSRGTTGINFVILPRFAPQKTLRKTLGFNVLPVGTRGIE